METLRISGLNAAVSLVDFVRENSKSLPLTVEVQRGHSGPSERMTISAGDIMNIHFVRHTKVFSAAKSLRSKPFNVPLNSSVQFGLLYDPNDNLEEAKQGFTYKKVSDLTALDKLPKVVCATKAWKGKDKDISKNEILVLKKHLISAKELKVFSVACSCEKTLPQECRGHFTTSPSAIALHLHDFAPHLPKGALPCKALFSNNVDSSLTHLIPGVVMLLEQGIETTLVASNALDKSQTFIDIPVDLPGVTVSIVESSLEQKQGLYHTTKQLVDQFDPSKIKSFGRKSNHDLLCTTAREGYEKVGVEIEVSSAIYEPIPFSQNPAYNTVKLKVSQSETSSQVNIFYFYRKKVVHLVLHCTPP